LERIGFPSNDTDVKAFLDKRPDGVAFDETKKKVCLFEFTRAMGAREEWEERKERDKTKRYALICLEGLYHGQSEFEGIFPSTLPVRLRAPRLK
jgi:hypothetical protein